MKRTVLLAIRTARLGLTLLAVLSITLFCTSPAKAAAPIPITNSACGVGGGNFITAPGDYILETDRGPCGPGDFGLVSVASNVTLHLNGHTITGSAACDSKSGILVGHFYGAPDTSGVHVIGPGTLSNWQTGVEVNHNSSSSVSLLKITANCGATLTLGFFFGSDSSRWTVAGNVVQEPGDSSAGILMFGSGNYIIGNRVNDSIDLVDSSNNIVSGNFASNNSGGIGVFGGSNNQILHNTTDNNGAAGILLTSGSTGNPTTGNIVSLNTSLNNTPYDTEDDSPDCGNDKWVLNNFKTANESCIH